MRAFAGQRRVRGGAALAGSVSGWVHMTGEGSAITGILRLEPPGMFRVDGTAASRHSRFSGRLFAAREWESGFFLFRGSAFSTVGLANHAASRSDAARA